MKAQKLTKMFNKLERRVGHTRKVMLRRKLEEQERRRALAAWQDARLDFFQSVD